MVDKIIMVNKTELVYIYTDRAPFTVYNSDYNLLLETADWLFGPSRASSVEEHKQRLQAQGEETCEISLKKV